MVMAGAASLAFLVAGNSLIGVLTDLPAVRATAGDYLHWVVAMPLLAAASYLLDGIFIGATRPRAMRDTMLAALLGVYLPVWWVAQPLGNHGLWLAFMAFTIARSVLLGAVFARAWQRGSWFADVPGPSAN